MWLKNQIFQVSYNIGGSTLWLLGISEQMAHIVSPPAIASSCTVAPKKLATESSKLLIADANHFERERKNEDW